jgi:hypothetical protein
MVNEYQILVKSYILFSQLRQITLHKCQTYNTSTNILNRAYVKSVGGICNEKVNVDVVAFVALSGGSKQYKTDSLVMFTTRETEMNLLLCNIFTTTSTEVPRNKSGQFVWKSKRPKICSSLEL